MENRYKLRLANKQFYKEIELPPDTQSMSIGTGMESQERLKKELFFEHIGLHLQKGTNGWRLTCSENLYLSTGDVRKRLSVELKHGDELTIHYQSSDYVVCSFSFTLDFDHERKAYDLAIDIAEISHFQIGATDQCDIRIQGEHLDGDILDIQQRNGVLCLSDQGMQYGVYVNGVQISSHAEVHEYDFFSIVGFFFYYRNGKLYTSSGPNLSTKTIPMEYTATHSTTLPYPKFNRNTRIQYQLPEEELEIKKPLANPNLPRKNLVLTLIPALIMLAVTIVLRGIIADGGTFVIYSAISMTLGIVMSIVSYFEERGNYKRSVAERLEGYNQYIAKKTSAIQQIRDDELRIRNLIYESLERSIDEATYFGKRLFERSMEDSDFLQIYLGKGTILSGNQVKYTEEDFADPNDPLSTVAEEMATSFRYLEQAPITADFNQSCGIGIVGAKAQTIQAIKNITLDLAIRHFYSDVRLAYLLSEEDALQLDWVRWLHNVHNSQLDVRNIACDAESRNLLLEYLYVTLSSRFTQRQGDDTKYSPHYVVFVTDVAAITNHPLSKYVGSCAKYGFTFVFLQEHEEYLPPGCAELIRLSDHQQGALVRASNGDVLTEFSYWSPTDALATATVQKLAGIFVEEVTLESQLRKSITLFEMMGILSVSDLDLEARWNASQVYNSMAAPLGVKSKDQLVYLDIGDKAGAHGPHGLVAGTTGSGKSEILQAYILSMSSLFHPYEVGFVIIDFKGGGMANQFKNLPHLVGSITNIDGREINRSLLSIKAELIKRQEIFSSAGVNHINDYIKLYKSKKVDVPMAHLIMIVDEFAELKVEHPDFMKELISAARIGRTLGIHLILATQKPAGVVDAQIWSNSKFKLCLKVQTKEDSNEVLKTPLAAEIVEPGRAYFQVGNNEIFEFFQSAYSGATVPEGNDSNDKSFAIYERNIWGKKTLKYTNKKTRVGQQTETQLQAVVAYVQAYCASHSILPLPGICLPSLRDLIPVSQLDCQPSYCDLISVPIGIFDDPEQQRQGFIAVELARENVYIVGAAQMGKTVFLQTTIYGLISRYTPQQVNLYLIDCGSMVLKLFEDAPHVGGVVLPSEEEKCKNLFKLIQSEIVQRKNKLSKSGVSNYAAYLEGGYTDMPLMAVVIDNMAGFKEYFPNQAEELGSIAREAQGVGLSLIITAVSANALSYRNQANFGRKLVLNCNDPSEYSAVLGHCKDRPKECVGRGLCVIDKRILEFHVAIFGTSTKDAERSQELKDYIATQAMRYTEHAKAIPMVPDRLVLLDSMSNHGPLFKTRGIIPVGMDFSTVEYTALNWNVAGSLSLVGIEQLREAWITNFLTALNRTIIFHEAQVVLVDESSAPLSTYRQAGFMEEYTSDSAEGLALIQSYCQSLGQRRSSDGSAKLLIIHNTQVLEKLCSDKTLSKMVADTLRNARTTGAFLLLSGIANQSVSFSAPELLKAVKEERQGILFMSLSENKLYETSSRIRGENTFDQSMAYRIDGANISKIKLFD